MRRRSSARENKCKPGKSWIDDVDEISFYSESFVHVYFFFISFIPTRVPVRTAQINRMLY